MSDESLPRWMRRIPTTSGDVPDAVPAATVVLLRDAPGGVETLMVRRSSKLEFAGGMWVFPGGRVDPDDIPADGDVIEAARHAAVREALEEADLVVDADGPPCQGNCHGRGHLEGMASGHAADRGRRNGGASRAES